MAIDRGRTRTDYLPLREVMNHLFEGSFISPQQFGGGLAFPPVDLSVTDDEVVAEMAVPGCNPDDLNVSVTGDTLTVGGETNRTQNAEKRQTYVQEMWHGTFQRSFTLPTRIDADKIDASYRDGVLTLHLPKADAAKPRKIQIGRQTDGGTGAGRPTIEGDVQKETVPR